jgi:hypothetical protein
MSEHNIFEIIKKEKKNITNVNLQNINKLFCKYILKYTLELKKSFDSIDSKLFNKDIKKISNMLFNIFWIIFLISFNIHITIFFLERASLLFIEYIKLSYEKKEDIDQMINKSIIFTYKKTIGDTSIDKIVEENKKQEYINQEKYKKIIRVRDSTYIFIKILDNILITDYTDIEKYKKSNKSIISNLFNIYQNIKTEKIDKYLFFKINKLLQEYPTEKALFIIRIIIDIINELSNIDLDNLNFFLNILDNTIEYYETNNLFSNININNKKIYSEIKEHVYRFIN